MDFRDLQRLLKGEVGQDGGNGPGKHGLAPSRRAHKQDIVAARRRDFRRPFGQILSPDPGEVIAQAIQLGRPIPSGLDRELPLPQELAYLGQAVRRADRQTVDIGGLLRVFPGEDEALYALLACGHGHGESSANRTDFSVKCQLSKKSTSHNRLLGQFPQGRQNADGDRQVIERALLAQVGRGQIDHDPAGRYREAGISDGGTHPLSGLCHRLVRQAHGII